MRAWAFGHGGHAVYRDGRRNRAVFGPGLSSAGKGALDKRGFKSSGRMYLERFATVLGANDAAMLGDGGNGYVFGSDAVREFLAQYRLLPATRFRRLVSASGRGRCMAKGQNILLGQYDCHFQSWSRYIWILRSRRCAPTGEAICSCITAKQKYPMRPFELLVFNGNRDEAVQQADAQLSEDDLARLRSLVERLEEQARSACQLVADEKCKRLDQSSKAERAALSQRAFWSFLRLIEATENQTITLGD